MAETRRRTLIASVGAVLMLAGTTLSFAVSPTSGALTPPSLDEVVSSVQICHRTNSVNNPYAINSPNVQSHGELQSGHSNHTGPIFDPDLHTSGGQTDWGDIIPPYRWGPGPDDVDPGMNWTADGQAIYAQDCAVLPTNITIVKQVTGAAPDTWNFPFQSPELGNFSLTSGSTSQLFGDRTAAAVTVTEVAPTDGAEFVSASCDGGDWSMNGTELSLKPPLAGSDITCTFTNHYPGASLTVEKMVTGAVPDTWSFGFSGGAGSFSLTNGAPSQSFSDLVSGSYTVTEDAHDDATLTSITCDDDDATTNTGQRSAAVDLAVGDDVTCTFTNHFPVPGAITIAKSVTGAAPDDWSFGFSGDLGDFSLTDESPSATTTDLPAGTYAVTEGDHSDADFVDIDCGNADVAIDGAAVSITLGEGDDVLCTYTNRFEPASLTVVKDTTGAVPDEWSFDFASETLGDFSLTDETTSMVFDGLGAGDYAVAEILAASNTGPFLIDIDCGEAVADVDQPGVAVTLDYGDDATCVFTNHFPVPGSITVAKQTTGAVPAEWSFDFTSPELGDFAVDHTSGAVSFDDVAIGDYTISEVDAGLLSDIDCGPTEAEATDDGSGVTVTMPEDGTIVCVFTNTYGPASITIVKAVQGAVPDDWEIDFAGDLGAFSLASDDSSTTFGNLVAGEYTITEPVDADGVWDLVGIDCGTADAEVDGESVTVNVGLGDGVTCTFTNDFVEVLGEPPAERTPEVQAVQELPRTGNDQSTAYALMGMLLLISGATLVAGSRRLATLGGMSLR